MNKENTYKNSITLPFCFNDFFQPGIYAIFNEKINIYYIREANFNYENWNYVNNEKRLTTNLARAALVNNNYDLSVNLAAAKE